jgi:RHS repeat-associated protein
MVLNSSGANIQCNNYYPFGAVFSQYSGSDNKYLFNGKELQEETDWLDYGARMYDASLGRWMCSDPLAEKAANWTPYRYCFNNPIRMIDLDGLYEWNFDMNRNQISYVSDWGGLYYHMIHNQLGGFTMNTTFMDLDQFTNVFGDPETLKTFIDSGKEQYFFTKSVKDYKMITYSYSFDSKKYVKWDVMVKEYEFKNLLKMHENELKNGIHKKKYKSILHDKEGFRKQSLVPYSSGAGGVGDPGANLGVLGLMGNENVKGKRLKKKMDLIDHINDSIKKVNDRILKY